jgi:nitrite reductase (NADH) large subunit
MKQPMKVAIIGNGVAGVMTAAELRKHEPDPEALRIDIYTQEPFDYYSRVRLPELFGSDLTAYDLSVYDRNWYVNRAVTVHRGAQATGLDRARKEIVLADGTRVPYDRLVLATGAEAVKPGFEGADLPGVFTIREYADADTVRHHAARAGGDAVVIGGGLLGLETASHLKKAGSGRVSVIEIAPRLLPRQLDETGAALLASRLREAGLGILTGAEVAAVTGKNEAEGVKLADGRVIAARTVVICMGIRPRIGLAEAAGLSVNRGVLVNENLATSDPAIFAAGDAAEFEGTVWGIIPAAIEQARAAAAGILGLKGAAYRPTVPRTTLKTAGVSLTSVGEVTGTLEGKRVFTLLEPVTGRYEKYILTEGILTGAILFGGTEHLSYVTRMIGKPVDAAEIERYVSGERYAA